MYFSHICHASCDSCKRKHFPGPPLQICPQDEHRSNKRCPNGCAPDRDPSRLPTSVSCTVAAFQTRIGPRESRRFCHVSRRHPPPRPPNYQLAHHPTARHCPSHQGLGGRSSITAFPCNVTLLARALSSLVASTSRLLAIFCRNLYGSMVSELRYYLIALFGRGFFWAK